MVVVVGVVVGEVTVTVFSSEFVILGTFSVDVSVGSFSGDVCEAISFEVRSGSIIEVEVAVGKASLICVVAGSISLGLSMFSVDEGISLCSLIVLSS